MALFGKKSDSTPASEVKSPMAEERIPTAEERVFMELKSAYEEVAKLIRYDRYLKDPVYPCCECGSRLGDLFCYDPGLKAFTCTECAAFSKEIGQRTTTKGGHNVVTLSTAMYTPPSIFDDLTESETVDRVRGVCKAVCKGNYICDGCKKKVRFVFAIDDETEKLYCEKCVGSDAPLERHILSESDLEGRRAEDTGLVGHKFLFLRADMFGDVPAWMPGNAKPKQIVIDPKLLKAAKAVKAQKGACAKCGAPIKDHFTCYEGKYNRLYCFKCLHWGGHLKEETAEGLKTVSYSAEMVIKDANPAK